MIPNPPRSLDVDSIAGFDSIGLAGWEFKDGIGNCETSPTPRLESLYLSYTAVAEPDSVDIKGDKHHMESPMTRGSKVEHEGVILGDGPSEHEPSSAGKHRVRHLDIGCKNPPVERTRLARLVDDPHGGGWTTGPYRCEDSNPTVTIEHAWRRRLTGPLSVSTIRMHMSNAVIS